MGRLASNPTEPTRSETRQPHCRFRAIDPFHIEDHAGFDDVRSVAMAILEVRFCGIQDWIGTALSTAALGDVRKLEAMVCRALEELDSLLKAHGVK